MNISRIALLSVLISAPMFATEAPTQNAPVTEVAATDASLLKKLGSFIALPVVFATEKTGNAAAFIADKSYLNALIGKVTAKNPELIGKYVVLTAAATTALYIAYNAYNAQDVDADEDMLFED